MNPYLDILLMLPFIGLAGWGMWYMWLDEDMRLFLVILAGVFGFTLVALFSIGLSSLISH